MLHVPLAIIIQLLSVIIGLDWYVGAAAGSWYFIGREYAQAEYRLIEHFYQNRRANMPMLAALRDKRAWNKKSILDWLLPTITTFGIAILINNI